MAGKEYLGADGLDVGALLRVHSRLYPSIETIVAEQLENGYACIVNGPEGIPAPDQMAAHVVDGIQQTLLRGSPVFITDGSHRDRASIHPVKKFGKKLKKIKLVTFSFIGGQNASPITQTVDDPQFEAYFEDGEFFLRMYVKKIRGDNVTALLIDSNGDARRNFVITGGNNLLLARVDSTGSLECLWDYKDPSKTSWVISNAEELASRDKDRQVA